MSSNINTYDRNTVQDPIKILSKESKALSKSIRQKKFKEELQRIFFSIVVLRYFYLVKQKIITGSEVYYNFMAVVRFLNSLPNEKFKKYLKGYNLFGSTFRLDNYRNQF